MNNKREDKQSRYSGLCDQLRVLQEKTITLQTNMDKLCEQGKAINNMTTIHAGM